MLQFVRHALSFTNALLRESDPNMPSYVETNNKENLAISILIEEDLPDDHQIQLKM